MSLPSFSSYDARRKSSIDLDTKWASWALPDVAPAPPDMERERRLRTALNTFIFNTTHYKSGPQINSVNCSKKNNKIAQKISQGVHADENRTLSQLDFREQTSENTCALLDSISWDSNGILNRLSVSYRVGRICSDLQNTRAYVD